MIFRLAKKFFVYCLKSHKTIFWSKDFSVSTVFPRYHQSTLSPSTALGYHRVHSQVGWAPRGARGAIKEQRPTYPGQPWLRWLCLINVWISMYLFVYLLVLINVKRVFKIKSEICFEVNKFSGSFMNSILQDNEPIKETIPSLTAHLLLALI